MAAPFAGVVAGTAVAVVAAGMCTGEQWWGVATLTFILTYAHVVDLTSFALLGLARLHGEILLRRAKAVGDVPLAALMRRVHTTSFVVVPAFIDRNRHMNNASYLRVSNLARRSFWHACGVWSFLEWDGRAARRQGRRPLNLVITAQSLRYRRELRLGEYCRVESRLRYWDESNFLLEHRFVQQNPAFVAAVQLVKYRLVGEGPDPVPTPKGAPLISRLLERVCRFQGLVPGDLQPGPLAEDLHFFLRFDQASSDRLRAEHGIAPKPSAPTNVPLLDR